ncbi:MAG: hypothetical protein GY870_01135, partial [archaeon]|nr:hypothetical protein [archaeon]
SVIPAIGLFISAIVMRWYSLDGPEWEQKKNKILELHKKKEHEYLQKLSDDKNSI